MQVGNNGAKALPLSLHKIRQPRWLMMWCLVLAYEVKLYYYFVFGSDHKNKTKFMYNKTKFIYVYIEI